MEKVLTDKPSQMPDPAEVLGLDNFKGSHRGGYAHDKLKFITSWLRKHPAATLGSGEGKILLDEIDRLQFTLDEQDAAQ